MIGLALLVVFVVGIGVLLFGWRGVVLLSEPHCANCGYDLRASLMANPPQQDAERRCPECGLDLRDRRAVHFGRTARRPRWMLAGGVMVALPLLVLATLVARPATRMAPNAARSDASVISDLATKANEPWGWRELEQRYRAGSLDQQEVGQAIDHLVAHLQAEHAKNGPETLPLHWSDQFLKLVDRGQSISDEQFLRLCQAYYGLTPQIEYNNRVRIGQPIKFTVKYGGPWDLPEWRFVKAVREARLSTGEALELTGEYSGGKDKNPDWFSQDGSGEIHVLLKHPFARGEHELTFVVDAGVVSDKSPMVAIDRRPGQMARWVNPRQTWSTSIPVKLTVVPADYELVTVTTDPALDPSAPFSPTLITRLAEKGIVLDVNYKYARTSNVPLSFDVVLKAGNSEHNIGMFAAHGDRVTYNSEVQLKAGLPPEVVTADLIFRPNPKHAERFPGVTQVWGRPITFENIRIDRYDLPPQ